MTSPKTVTVASNRLTARVSTAGAELVGLTLDEHTELQWSGDPTVWKGRAPILFPNIGFLNGATYRHEGRTYSLSKHGFARDMMFRAIDRTDTAVTLRVTATDQTRLIYPFDFELDVRFEVTDATLSIKATVANGGDAPMPASFGFHPAFRWPLPFGQPRAAHRIVLASDEPAPIRRIGADGLLVPERFPNPVVGNELRLADDLFNDDAVIFDRLESRSLRYGANTGPQLRIDFPDLPMLGVWTKPGAEFVCIEPWAGLPDPAGFEGEIWAKPGIFRVDPGAERSLRMAITVEDRH